MQRWHLEHRTVLGYYQFISVQLLSHVRLFVTPWTAACQASLSITSSRSPPKPMSIESVMPSNHFILCHPLLLLHPTPPSIRVFSNESTLCMRWPKYWSFIFNISPCNERPGLISFRMDWHLEPPFNDHLLDLLRIPSASFAKCTLLFLIAPSLFHPMCSPWDVVNLDV